MREIIERHKKWRLFIAHRVSQSISLKSIPPKQIYRFRAIPVKMPMTVFTELEKKILKCVLSYKTQNIPNVLNKKNQAEGITYIILTAQHTTGHVSCLFSRPQGAVLTVAAEHNHTRPMHGSTQKKTQGHNSKYSFY